MRSIFLGILLSILIVFGLVSPIFAISNPSSISIGAIYAFKDVLEDGDQLFYVRYDLYYDPVPEENAEDTWQIALYDSNWNLVKTRPLNYYQHNMISIYLSPEDAISWGAANKVRIMGMPSVFNPLVEGTNMLTRSLGTGDYYDADQLGGIIITEAGILEDSWETTLLTSQDKLNNTGSYCFTAAIPGLNSMVPEIFEITVVGETVQYTPWSKPYEETLAGHSGTRLDNAITDIGNLFGVSKHWMGAWMLSILFLVFAGTIFTATRNPAVAIAGGFPVLIAGIWLGVGGSNVLIGVLLTVLVVAIMFGLYFVLGRFA